MKKTWSKLALDKKCTNVKKHVQSTRITVYSRIDTWMNSLSFNNPALSRGTCVTGTCITAILVPRDDSSVHSISDFLSHSTSIPEACERRSSSIKTWLISNCLTITLVPSDSPWLQIQLRRPLDFSYSISALSASNPSWPSRCCTAEKII